MYWVHVNLRAVSHDLRNISYHWVSYWQPLVVVICSLVGVQIIASELTFFHSYFSHKLYAILCHTIETLRPWHIFPNWAFARCFKQLAETAVQDVVVAYNNILKECGKERY